MKKNIIARIRVSRNDLYLMIAAFICYTGMYAVRKSFLAAQFNEQLLFGYDYKTVLVLSQVFGYMLSKFIGIKLVSESKGRKSEWMLAALVSAGLLFLFIMVFLPISLRPLAMFFNGLSLGMIFGLVLSFLEGRRNTELLVAALSATFIFSTGFIKTIGVWLMQDLGVSEIWMPFVTGLLFFPLFIGSVFLLGTTKAPDETDIQLRTERLPMDKSQRKGFIKKHGLLFFGLVLVYVLLTASRDFRDNFTVEFWSELGYADEPKLITLTEIPIALAVLVISALAVLVFSNKKAFVWSMVAVLIGALCLWGSTILLEIGALSPIFWMIVSGLGIYLPYILFHCVVFERLLALIRHKGTIGFLFYVADALGYLVSVTILLGKEIFDYKGSWLGFFLQLNTYVGAGMVILTGFIIWKVYTIKDKHSTIDTIPVR